MTRRGSRGRASPDRNRKRRQLRKPERLAAEHQRRQEGLKRARTIVGFSAAIPLLGSSACDFGLAIMCVPFTWYMWMWAAIFGAFLGLTIRLIRERRRFEERTRAG